ncbi:MAG: DUF1801 domain-containing protein [Chloroflexi bacterium]|nr:DUF1801 domain-containing protein [Chloroflexota bacterium]
MPHPNAVIQEIQFHRAIIDQHLAALPPERRAWMEEMRQTIRAAAPEAAELFSYGMPGFKYRGRPLAYYSAWKNHYGYYAASGEIIAANMDALKGLATSKGTIQFPLDKPVPAALVKKMVKARMAEIDREEAAMKAKKPKSRKG